MPIPSLKLADKTALVTGASKGIGAAIAKALAAEGAAVVVNYASSRDAADRVVNEITLVGGRAVAIQGDVSKKADIDRLLVETQKAFGPLDILVNNAGIYLPAPVGSITEENFHRQFDLNVLGLVLLSQEALPYFRAAGGSIVNVSSVVARLSLPGLAVYSATKAAVDSVTRTFARELAPKKIRVNAVNPGIIATEGTHSAGFVEKGQEASPLGPVGKPEAIASIVTFLASDEARWINGETHFATGEIL
ncbi:3-oxoacyl-[acyl-carrier protein] reductase [Verrucomicrobium sp. GAS474]|uniref:SDR family NAD(P)-dependent oxidoreductase n=1 Tax=Verrucomicrobium sp. GAS474 TaxID=1882831 RepID=UPI00087ACD2E|nr:glucose 1-dehydrogenase [Verrucomicrobium sp. GAS474]SDT88914.1 3-oxoacyl-[acyl-carrier protein] reductase [Verrucomicrobium sp. GAS474]